MLLANAGSLDIGLVLLTDVVQLQVPAFHRGFTFSASA
jgi:hypothetical protein